MYAAVNLAIHAFQMSHTSVAFILFSDEPPITPIVAKLLILHVFLYDSIHQPNHMQPPPHSDFLSTIQCFNLLQPTGYVMHHQFNIQQL